MRPASFALTLLVLASLACSLGSVSPSAPAEQPGPTTAATPAPSTNLFDMVPSTEVVNPKTAVSSTPSTNPTLEPAPANPTDSPPTTAPAAPTETAPAPSPCANRYYPIAKGASWQYQLSGTTSDTFTRSIVNLRETGFDEQDVFSAGTTRRASWECQQGNLISLTPSGGASVSFADEKTTVVIESNSGVTLPANLRPDAQWTQNLVYTGQYNIGGANMQARAVVDLSCKAIGVETVSVPAGRFDALRVDCSTRFQISLSGTTISINDTSSAWYAPGVGMVKSSGNSNMGATEIVLLSYAIP